MTNMRAVLTRADIFFLNPLTWILLVSAWITLFTPLEEVHMAKTGLMCRTPKMLLCLMRTGHLAMTLYLQET